MLDIFNAFIIFLIWLLFYPSILHYVSQKISLIGVYHELKRSNPKGEPFLRKLCEISKCNLVLSLPIILSFYIIILTTNSSLGSKDAFLLSLPFAIVSLSTARVLSNPCMLTKPSLAKFHDPEAGDEIIKMHKERMISFFFSFICTSMILLLIFFSYGIFIELPVDILHLPPLTPKEAAEIMILYLVCLELATLTAETLLATLLKPTLTLRYDERDQ
jgi:hypothetical protein